MLDSPPTSPVLFLGDCRVDGSFGEALCQVPALFPDVACFVICLECAVAEPGAPRAIKSYPFVAGYEEFSRVLTAFAGRQVVFNLANNHSLDAGPAAKEQFIRWCAAQGVALVDEGSPARVELACGTRLGLAAGCDPTSHRAIGQLECWEAATAEALKAHADLTVFLPHWGEEYVFYPSPRQVRTTRALWAAGFDLVVGCHPHVVQGTASQGRQRAFFSLGNGTIYLDVMQAGSRIGAALLCTVTPGGAFQAELRPYTVATDGALRLLAGAEVAAFHATIATLSDHPAGAWWWRRQAARAFFRNHLPSWGKRIREHGALEVAKLIRACLTLPYWRLGTAWLMSLGRATPNDAMGGRLDRLAATTQEPTSASTLLLWLIAGLESGLLLCSL